MKGKNEMKKMGKVNVYNIIILDRSGSMSVISEAAIGGFNETLAGIRKSQKENSDVQDHYITLVAFCGCGVDYIYDMVPVEKARSLTRRGYKPCCSTPLYDAMGFTLTKMRGIINNDENAIAAVTIITDGEENASKEYSSHSIKRLVEELKEEGWTFKFIGANQDVLAVSASLSIEQHVTFDYSDAGMWKAFQQESIERGERSKRLREAPTRRPGESDREWKRRLINAYEGKDL